MSNTRAAKKRAPPQSEAPSAPKKTRRNSSEDRALPNVSPPKKRALASQMTPPSIRRRSPRNTRNSRGAATPVSNATQVDKHPLRVVKSTKRALHLQHEELVSIPTKAPVDPITPEITPVKELNSRPGQEDTVEPSPRRSPRTKTALYERRVREVPAMIMDSDDEDDEDVEAEDEERDTERERRDRENRGKIGLGERRARVLEADADDLFEEEGSSAIADRCAKEFKQHLLSDYGPRSDDGGITEVPETTVGHLLGDDPGLDIDMENTEQPQVLGAVTTTNSVLKAMFGKLEGMFNARLNTLTSSLVERMDKTDKRFDEVATQLADIHAIVSRTNTSNKAIDTPLNRFNKMLDKLTPGDGLVVNRDACHRILCSIVPFEVIRTVRDNTLAKERLLFRFSIAIQVLLCGKNPKETRKQFREGIGGRQSRFKKNVVLNFIYNVQLNSFGMFADESAEAEVAGDQNGNVADAVPETSANPEGRNSAAGSPVDVSKTAKVGKMRQPDWLKKGFILETDIEHARLVQDYSKSEASKRRRKDGESDSDSGDEEDGEYTPGPGNMQAPEKVVVKEVPTRRDIGRHGAWKIYKLMGKHLNQSRKKCKSAFFEHLGFLMVPWSGAGVSVDQSRLTVRWGFPEFDASKSKGGRLQDIKDTKTKSSGDVNLNDHNSNLLSELYGKRQDMILVISHEVQVTEASGSSKKKRNRTTKRVINKAVNVVEAAAKFCTEFAQGSDSERSPLPFLLGHKDALRCILGIALVFKNLTSQFLDKNCDHGRIRDVNNMDTTGIKCGNLRLSELIPGRSSQIRSLSGTVLRMKDNVYCKLNVGTSPRNGGAGADMDSVEGQRSRDPSAQEIQASMGGGVFAI